MSKDQTESMCVPPNASSTTNTPVRREENETTASKADDNNRVSTSSHKEIYVVHVSWRFLLTAVLGAVVAGFGIGRFSRRAILGQVVGLLKHGKGPKHQASQLPIPTFAGHKKAPDTVYTSKNFATGRSATSSSLLAQRRGGKEESSLVECSVDATGSQVCSSSSNNYNGNSTLEYLEDEELHLPTGQHLLVDIEHVDASFLNSEERLATAMIELVQHSDLTLLSYHCHGFEPMGVSCVGVLFESHVSFHTWPVPGVITLDLFTCGSGSLLPLIPSIKELFGVPKASGGEEPNMAWGHKKRGFRSQQGQFNPEDVDLSKGLLGNMELVKKQVASVETDFQKIDIYDVLNPRFRNRDDLIKSRSSDGSYQAQHPELFSEDRVVYLDNIMQSRRFGDAAYHETLVHPAMFVHENPKRVAIIGGGEGATLREVLKHNTVEKVVMIDIDEVMVNVSKAYLPEWSDCRNLEGSAPSCFDDPRTSLFCEDAIAWFMDRFGEDIDKESVRKEAPFDVIIMDALDPSSVVEFSDMLYNSQDLMDTFANALGKDGILIVQVGEADALTDPFPMDQFIHGLDKAGFQSITEYAEAHGGFESPWSFLVAMKSDSSRSNWITNEAEINVAIHDRTLRTLTGDIPLRYFDGATMMSYQFPSRIVEELWCRQPGQCEGEHGFDPETHNYSVDYVETRPSMIAKGGRGVFAKQDLKKGSFIGLEESVHGMFLTPHTFNLLHESMEAFDFDYFDTIAGGYVDGYGWSDSFYGEPAGGVETGITLFLNHGCNGTYNYGEDLPFFENSHGLVNGPGGFFEDPSFYNPRLQRTFPYWEVTNDILLRDVKAGEEILDNYLTHGGSDDLVDWGLNLKQLRDMCNGRAGGIVHQYEEERS